MGGSFLRHNRRRIIVDIAYVGQVIAKINKQNPVYRKQRTLWSNALLQSNTQAELAQNAKSNTVNQLQNLSQPGQRPCSDPGSKYRTAVRDDGKNISMKSHRYLATEWIQTRCLALRIQNQTDDQTVPS